MRVHELDEAYRASKEEVRDALTLAGLPAHHLANLNDVQLKSFELALEALQEDGMSEALDAAVEASLEDFDSALAGEPSPLEDEHTPQEHIFPVCDDRGEYRGNCVLPPDLAELVAPLLGNHRINSYLLDLDRGEFIFVVYETAFKHRVRIPGHD